MHRVRKIVIWEGGASDAPATATNFSGFGYQGTSNTSLRSTGMAHYFWTGSTQAYFINSSGGFNGTSDIRFKSELVSITNAISKVSQL